MERLNEAKLRSWMQRLGPGLIALSHGICHDRHQAEEIVQEAFIKLWRKPPDAGEVAFASWLRRVVTNLSINALQRTKRPRALPEYGADRSMQHDPAAGERLAMDEELQQIHEAMERLEPAKRAILMLRAREDLSYDQIADHLGVPVGTVMSRLNRARAALQDELEQVKTGLRGGREAPASYDFRRYQAG